jgi:hypothetical protein
MTKIKEILLAIGLIMVPVYSTSKITNTLIKMQDGNPHESIDKMLKELKEDETISPTVAEDIRHSILEAGQVVFSKTIGEEDIPGLLEQVKNTTPLEKEGFARQVKEKYAALMLARTLTNFDDCINQTDSHAQIMTLEHTLNNFSICFLLLDDKSDVKTKLKMSLDKVIDAISRNSSNKKDMTNIINAKLIQDNYKYKLNMDTIGVIQSFLSDVSDNYIVYFAKYIKENFGHNLPIPTWVDMKQIIAQLKTELGFI